MRTHPFQLINPPLLRRSSTMHDNPEAIDDEEE
jgi:hypothetical protein